LGRGFSRPLQENFNRKLLGASGIADHFGNHACDAHVLSRKNGLKIDLSLAGVHSDDCFRRQVHNTITFDDRDL